MRFRLMIEQRRIWNNRFADPKLSRCKY